MFQPRIASFFSFNCLLLKVFYLFAIANLEYNNGLVTVTLELLAALLEHLNLFDGFVQFAAVEASLLPQNASIIPDSYTYQLCLKLCWHNHLPMSDYAMCLFK